jgi:hypothetical protein
MKKLAAAQIDTHMAFVFGRLKEDQVSRLELASGYWGA